MTRRALFLGAFSSLMVALFPAPARTFSIYADDVLLGMTTVPWHASILTHYPNGEIRVYGAAAEAARYLVEALRPA